MFLSGVDMLTTTLSHVEWIGGQVRVSLGFPPKDGSVRSPVADPLKACGNDGLSEDQEWPLPSKLRGIDLKRLNFSASATMTWDLTSYFPQFDGPEMRQFKAALRGDVASLMEQAASLPSLNTASADQWEKVLLRNEDLSRRLSHLSSYVSCLASSDASNESYLKEEATLARLRAESGKIRIELLRAIKNSPDDAFSSFTARPALTGAEHYLTRLREEARRAMAPEKEVLATDLAVDGIQSWGRLYGTLSSKLEFDMLYPDGRRQRLPMSQRRSLMDHPDRRIRKAAFDGGNAAWQTVEDTAAAALNAIAGTRLTLNHHRGVEHFLDIALFQASIGRNTLDAMFAALLANRDLPRRILRLKASQTGTKPRCLVRSRRALGSAESRNASLGQGDSHCQRVVPPRLSGPGKFLPRSRYWGKIGWIGSPAPASGPGVFAQAPCCPRSRAFS